MPLTGYLILGWDIYLSSESAQAIRMVAWWAAIGSLLYMLVVLIAGAVCKVSRKLLLAIFAPGLYISSIAISVIVVAQGFVLVGTLYYIEAAIIGRVHYFLLLLLAFAAILGAVTIIGETFNCVRRAKITVVGNSLKSEEYPHLWEFVSDIAKQVEVEIPHHLIVGLTPTFFVTEANVECWGEELKGRTMYISAPLCRILDRQQLEGIIAHELGHFKGLDTQFSLNFYPIYRGTVDSLQAIVEAIDISGRGAVALIPGAYMLSFFLECFSGAEKKLSRERELAADALAGQVAGAPAFATGLVKVLAFSGVWVHLTMLMYDWLKKGTVTIDEDEYEAHELFSNLSNLFVMYLRSEMQSSLLNGLDSKNDPHPTDTHPPLSVRLAALNLTLEDVRNEALNISPEHPASSLIDNLEGLEMRLSAFQQLLINPRLLVNTDVRDRFFNASKGTERGE